MRFWTRSVAIILFLTVVGLQVCLAQQFWEKKPYRDWSAKEVAQMLKDSPWTRSVTISAADSTLAGTRGRSGLVPSDDVQTESMPRIDYQVQLRSAAPLRQAVARKVQLDARYDSLDAAHKAGLDAKVAAYLATTFNDSVVIQVTYTSNSASMLSDIRRYWMAQTAPQLQATMFLNAGGEKLPMTSFLAEDGLFQISFARPKQLEAGGNLSLEFMQPAIKTSVLPEQRVVVQFKPKTMVLNGAVQF